jgi:DnaD/phage-associated family protein
LIPNLDRNGAFYADPAVIKSKIFSRHPISVESCSEILSELERTGLVHLYEHDGRQYLYCPAFFKHQTVLRPDREPDSGLPPPPGTDDIWNNPLVQAVTQNPDPRNDPIVAKLATLWSNEIGRITPIVTDQIVYWANQLRQEKTPIEWIDDAFAEAVKQRVVKPAYISAILQRWTAQGHKGKANPSGRVQQYKPYEKES